MPRERAYIKRTENTSNVMSFATHTPLERFPNTQKGRMASYIFCLKQNNSKRFDEITIAITNRLKKLGKTVPDDFQVTSDFVEARIVNKLLIPKDSKKGA